MNIFEKQSIDKSCAKFGISFPTDHEYLKFDFSTLEDLQEFISHVNAFIFINGLTSDFVLIKENSYCQLYFNPNSGSGPGALISIVNLSSSDNYSKHLSYLANKILDNVCVTKLKDLKELYVPLIQNLKERYNVI